MATTTPQLDAAQALTRQITPRLSKYCPHKPTPKQIIFLLLNCQEAFYGGAAGGGKSDALLMAATQFIDVPGYNALLLRRTFADLIKPEALMDRAHEWFQGTNARWVERDKKWIFPTGGPLPATLSFGYMETPNDRYQYQGSAYHFVGWDELTQFQEMMYRYLFSRQRSTKKFKQTQEATGITIPLRMRSAGNPGGIGHFWVRDRFIGPMGRAEGRVFIPASLSDNPHVAYEEYVAGLMQLDAVEREQLLMGNWEAAEGGGQFDRKWVEGKVRSFKAFPPMVKLIRAWDLAATRPNTHNPDPDWTVGALVGVDAEHNYYILDVRRIRDNPGEVAEFVRQTCEEDEKNWDGRVMTWVEQEPGSSGKIAAHSMKKDTLAGFPVQFQKTSGTKEHRFKIVAIAARDGFLYVKQGFWNGPLLDELEALGIPEVHDDQGDAISLALSKLRPSQQNVGLATEPALAARRAEAERKSAHRTLTERLVAAANLLTPAEENALAEQKMRESAAYQNAMKRGSLSNPDGTRLFDFGL